MHPFINIWEIDIQNYPVYFCHVSRLMPALVLGLVHNHYIPAHLYEGKRKSY